MEKQKKKRIVTWIIAIAFSLIMICNGISGFIEKKDFIDFQIVIGFLIVFIVSAKRLKKNFNENKQKKQKNIDKTVNQYAVESVSLNNMIRNQVNMLDDMAKTLLEFKNSFYTMSDEEKLLYIKALQSVLSFVKNMSNTVNTTTDIETFVEAYSSLNKGFEVLEQHEFTGFFKNSPPSNNHREILNSRHHTEMDFLKRAYPKGVSANFLTGINAKYFRTFTPETIEYIKNNGNETNKIQSINFDYMEGHEFEYFCAEFLKKKGYNNISVTQGSGDQGIDIIAFKDDVKYGIQCKCYSSDIGNKAVQEAYSGSRFYDCHVPVVLTNRYFTKSAKELAQKNGVLLWDRDYLTESNEQVSVQV